MRVRFCVDLLKLGEASMVDLHDPEGRTVGRVGFGRLGFNPAGSMVYEAEVEIWEHMLPKSPKVEEVDIIFDGPPGPWGPRLVDAELAETKKAVKVGEWGKYREKGWHALRVSVVLPPQHE